MFKNILIPTDGSVVAGKAVGVGVALAREMGARITGYSAFEPVPAKLHLCDLYYVDRGMSVKLERCARDLAKTNVIRIGKLARKAGVRFKLGISKAHDPAAGIIRVARKQRCDAIVMASHGAGPVAGLLLGSVAQRVLAHSKIPVFIYR